MLFPNIMPHKVSLKDIARRAGLSTATVSLALRNEGTTSSRTRERVQLIAKEMGYRPNPLLASLAARQFRSPESVGQLPLVFLSTQARNQDGGSVYSAARAAAMELGYSMDLINPTAYTSAENLSRTLYNRGVGGIILGALEGVHRLPALDWDLFSVLSCGRNNYSEHFHTVRPSILRDTATAWNQLQKLGYGQIAPVFREGSLYRSDNEARLAAILACQHREASDALPVIEWNPLKPGCFVEYLERFTPECILVNDASVREEMKALVGEGMDTLPIVTLDLEANEVEGAPGILIRMDKISKVCVDLLSDMIRHGQKGLPSLKQEILVESDWVPGHLVSQSY